MATTAFRKSLFRDREDEASAPVTNIELFFDLVFVFAITQLSHRLLNHFTVQGALETLVLFTAVWWGWINTSWATNWLDPEHPLIRSLLVALMLIGLLMSGAIPGSFAKDGLTFGLAHVVMQLGRTAFVVWALTGVDQRNRINFIRILIWLAAAAVFWMPGIWAAHTARLYWWAVAIAIEFTGPVLRFRVPGLGASNTDDWNISGRHLAERCSLFVIIALGEALVVTGASFAALPKTMPVIAAFLSAFFGSVTMWWIYFDVGAVRATAHIEQAKDPGRIARGAYSYWHMPIIAGIIVAAVGDALVLTLPGGKAPLSFVVVAVGGPFLFIAGTMAFKRSTSRMTWFPLSHQVGLALLILCAAAAPIVSPLVLSSLVTGALIAVAIWETISLRNNPELAEAEAAA